MMKQMRLLACLLILTTTSKAQTTFRLELIAEGNFGSPTGDVFVRNTMVNPAVITTGTYQLANSSTGFDVLQDYVIAGNKAVLAEKPNGAGRITIVDYPAMTEIQTFAQAPQTLGVASATKVYACYAQGGIVSLVDLQNNTLTPVIEPNGEITSYCNHMQFANGFMYLDQAGQLVKIDTVTNTVVSKFNPGVGSIAGIATDNQGKLWVIGGSSIVSVDVLNNDALGTVVNMGINGKLLRYYDNNLYFWENTAKNLYKYSVVTPPSLPLAPAYTSTLIGTTGTWGTFGYGRSFDIDQSTGDFVIASANNYTAPGYYEVVDGTTFALIESGSIPGCAIPNKCVLKTQHTVVGPNPVPDQASLVSISGQCSASVTAPTADNGAVTATTTDPTTYSVQGTYTVTWTYTNANGNTTQTQTVVVDDTTDPVAAIFTMINVTCNQVVTAPTANDNCTGTVTGTTTDPVSYPIPGNYTIDWVFDDGNGNSATQAQTVVVSCSSTGLDDLNASDLSIYPVPASNNLFIETTALVGEVVSVFDTQGQKVFDARLKSGKTTLDVSVLEDGFYFLKVGTSSLRFVVSK